PSQLAPALQPDPLPQRGLGRHVARSARALGPSMKARGVRIAPLFNHAIVFSTTEESYHGHPDPLTCPPGVTRKSIALYYYTVETATASAPRSTNYRARPGDGAKAGLIWLDKQLL